MAQIAMERTSALASHGRGRVRQRGCVAAGAVWCAVLFGLVSRQWNAAAPPQDAELECRQGLACVPPAMKTGQRPKRTWDNLRGGSAGGNRPPASPWQGGGDWKRGIEIEEAPDEELEENLEVSKAGREPKEADAEKNVDKSVPQLPTLAKFREDFSWAVPWEPGKDEPKKVNLYELRPIALQAILKRVLGQPKSRAKRLRTWIYERGVRNFDEMRDFSHELRDGLRRFTTIGSEEWQVRLERVSKDGTTKRAYSIPGGHMIESVLMPYDDGRVTACISTQAGCAQGCVFCATGQMGFKRHLTANEIFEQAARFAAEMSRRGDRLSQVVLLGMGEPLHNYNNSILAIRRINAELGIGMRHITISTVGLAPQIRQLADEQMQLTLAISLHAASDEKRSALLPVNRRYQIAEVMEAARYYFEMTGRRVSFEWTLIEGQNDDVATAHELAKWLRAYVPVSHVNVIPLNPTYGYSGSPTQREAIAKFIGVLDTYSIPSTVRVRRGIDIEAGCGQLAERAAAEYDGEEQVTNSAAGIGSVL